MQRRTLRSDSTGASRTGSIMRALRAPGAHAARAARAARRCSGRRRRKSAMMGVLAGAGRVSAGCPGKCGGGNLLLLSNFARANTLTRFRAYAAARGLGNTY